MNSLRRFMLSLDETSYIKKSRRYYVIENEPRKELGTVKAKKSMLGPSGEL